LEVLAVREVNPIFAFSIDANGQATSVDWEQVVQWGPSGGFLWIHLDRNDENAEEWLCSEADLDMLAAEALLAEETRPRIETESDATLAILRGVNLNPGSDPEDMVSVRLWIKRARVISIEARPLLAIRDIAKKLEAQRGPKTPGEFVAILSARLIDRMGPVIGSLEDELDALEEALIEGPDPSIREGLSRIRRMAVALRRYLGPQRDVITRASTEDTDWLDSTNRARLRECSDRITRYVEELDAGRERASVTQDELAARLSEQTNRTMYVLSLVAALFLPLGFLTGLLGINVGGIPGTENPVAFLVVCTFLLLVAGVELWFFWRWRWLKVA
jgi:zinc transporter